MDIKTDVLVRVALKNGLVDEAAINEALRERAEAVRNGMPSRKLGDILVEKGLIDFTQARESLRLKRVKRIPDGGSATPSFDAFEELATELQPAADEETAVYAEESEQRKAEADGEPATDAAATEEDPGETQRREMQARFGDYKIIQRLGADASGITYRAVYLRDHRAVSLRVLSLQLALSDPEAVESFLATVKTAYKLDHPNIQKILTAGRQDQRLYYTAEYFTGHSLRKELATNRILSVRAAADLAIEVAEALKYAHGKGVYHTQIDPAKIVLGTDGHIKLLGFGLGGDVTKNLDWLAESLGDLPYYVAPEMATGEEGRKLVGPVTDLYSLGAVLFHCLSGTPPFHGDTLEEVLLDMYQSENLLERLRYLRGVPQDMVALVLELLNPEPQKRPQSAGAILPRLRAIAKEIAKIEKEAQKAAEEAVRAAQKRAKQAAESAASPRPTTKSLPAHTQPAVRKEKTKKKTVVIQPLADAPAGGRRPGFSARLRQRLQRHRASRQMDDANKGKLWQAGLMLVVLGLAGLGVYLLLHFLGRGNDQQKDILLQRSRQEEAKKAELLFKAKERELLKEEAKKEIIKTLKKEGLGGETAPGR